MIEHKTQGSIIRSKTRWYNEGEKNTKYFLNLEKRHFNRKTIRGLKLENGTKIDSDKEIRENAKSFTKNSTHRPSQTSVVTTITFSQKT